MGWQKLEAAQSGEIGPALTLRQELRRVLDLHSAVYSNHGVLYIMFLYHVPVVDIACFTV